MDHIFVLLKSDALFRSLLIKILQFLEKEGFYLVDFICARFSEDFFALCYEKTFRWDLDDWTHNNKAFSFGPFVGVLLEDKKRESRKESSLTYLHQLKGSAFPFHERKGTIREKFSSVSRNFNLLHIPDDFKQSEEQRKKWFGEKNFFPPSCSIEMLEREIDEHDYFSQYLFHPFYTLIKGKRRLLHLMEREFVPFLEKECRQLKDFFSSESNRLKKEKKLSLEKERESFQRERMLWEALYNNGQELSFKRKKLFFQTMHFLKMFGDGRDDFSLADFFSLLDRRGVFLSDLEKYLIVCWQKYFLPKIIS